MSAPTSSSGRCQFSELNAYSVERLDADPARWRASPREPPPSPHGGRTRAGVLALGPWPFPSMMIATWRGTCLAFTRDSSQRDRGLLGHARLIARVAGRPRARTSVAARV